MSNRRRWIALISLSLASVALPHTASAATVEREVTPSDAQGWTFDEEGSATASFQSGPGAPPAGVGSYGFEVSSASDGIAARTDEFDGIRLDALTELSFWTHVESNVNCQAAYVSLRVDEDGDGDGDNSLFFEPCYQDGTYQWVGPPGPTQDAVALDTWQQWGALAGGWWDRNQEISGAFGPPVFTLADYLAVHPDARIFPTVDGGGLRVFGGFGVPITGAFDGVTIGVTGSDAISFDFEPDVEESTVVVSPSSMHGWGFVEEIANATGEMVIGPDTPPLGQGSARMTLDTNGRELLLTGDYAGTRFDEIESLGYSTYRASADPGNNLAISLQFDTDYDLTDGNGDWQGRLVFEPYLDAGGTVVQDTWQAWSPMDGLWWASGSPGNGTCPQADPCTWEEVLTAFPDAGIRVGDAFPGFVNLKAGGPWDGFDGNVDALTIGVSSGATITRTTYDFEPDALSGCPVIHDHDAKTTTLLADCIVDETLTTLNGYDFNGDGYAITAVDPSGGHFLGAVIQAGAGDEQVTIHDLRVTTNGLADVCDPASPTDTRLRGILFNQVGGAIHDTVVMHIQQGTGSGCQEGNAIEVRNVDGGPSVMVTIEDNQVSDYIKNGITVNGDVTAEVYDNTATGNGPVGVPQAAQNGIQIGFGASAKLIGNTATMHEYTPEDFQACGLLLFRAGGVSASKNGMKFIRDENSFTQNERDICNFGKGGSFSSSEL